MKFFNIILATLSLSIFSAEDNKLDPIIFMLDLSVIDGNTKEAEEFTYKITKKVKANEPGTVIYQYFFGSNDKVFLYEVYKSNQAAIKHVEDFRGSTWEAEFGGLFSIDNFAVLGNSSNDLKESLEDYTTDFRTLKGGFHKPAQSLGNEIFKL
jgi:quinol monooxygenase YgiN